VPLPPLPDLETLEQTRTSWHALAEHVLAAARHRATGRIGLRATPGAFGTSDYDDGGATTQVRVAGRDLVVRRGDRSTTTPITTIAAAAAAAGIEPGAPTDVYTPTTSIAVDAPLPIDDAAAELLASWLETTWDALETLRREAPAGLQAVDVQLWPEHFDAATELGDEERGTRGTFGTSPGDGQHPTPYLYVTHWSDVPDDPFWNDTAFAGASLTYQEVASAPDPGDAILSFFQRGVEVLTARG